MPLTNLQIKNAPKGMHADGNGLYLAVTGKGAKSWIFRYQLGGKRREMGLGPVVALSGPEARAKVAQLKLMVANGVDPLAEREAERLAAEEAARAAELDRERQQQTFEKVAETYIADHAPGWSNVKHIQQWTNTLKTYVYPKIGSKPVDSITTADVVAILKPIWAKKPETASRVRMRIEAVLNSAKALGWRDGENPAVWKGGLDAVLPRRGKLKTVRHHPAMPHSSAPAFMAALKTREGMGARALEFTILTAARSGEVRGARWDEIDLEKALWVIPATRMKAKREHRVPLSSAAVALLKAMPRYADCALVFPGTKRQPLSDMSLSAVLKRMDLRHFTVHGFRSTFRDWAAEQGFAFDAIEAALAHKIGNSVVTAYLRTDHLEMRKGIMQVWADHLASHAACAHAGFVITASWPVNTEASNSLHIRDKAAANSTIFLVCRPRAGSSNEAMYWEDIEPEVARAVRARVGEFQQAGIQGVDLYLASFGPALEAFSRHWPLTRGTPAPEPKKKRRTQGDMFEEFDPYAVRPEDALNAARREVKAWRLAQLASAKAQADMDGPTAFYVLAWDAFKAVSFPYDEALRLARAVGVDLDTLSSSLTMREISSFSRAKASVALPSERTASVNTTAARGRLSTAANRALRKAEIWSRPNASGHLRRYSPSSSRTTSTVRSPNTSASVSAPGARRISSDLRTIS